MPTYTYENAKGERREIVASMKDSPPERIRCLSGDHRNPQWRAAHKSDRPEDVFRRVFEPCRAVSVPDAAVKRTKNGLPVSRTLPLQAGGTVKRVGGQTIKVHENGLRTDLNGRVIVANKSDVAAVKRLGYERE